MVILSTVCLMLVSWRRLPRKHSKPPLPAGVFNVVSGDASAIGEALLDSPLVRKLGFTGSTKVGKYLMERCAATVKRISMELGAFSSRQEVGRHWFGWQRLSILRGDC